jgi:hypothetical protein
MVTPLCSDSASGCSKDTVTAQTPHVTLAAAKRVFLLVQLAQLPGTTILYSVAFMRYELTYFFLYFSYFFCLYFSFRSFLSFILVSFCFSLPLLFPSSYFLRYFFFIHVFLLFFCSYSSGFFSISEILNSHAVKMSILSSKLLRHAVCIIVDYQPFGGKHRLRL